MKKEDVIGWNIKVADSFWSRLKGLLGKRKLEYGEGMLLKPCRQIHTWFMSFPIDVLFLDKKGRIVEVLPSLPPGSKSAFVKEGYQVLELPAGAIQKFSLKTGETIEILLTDPIRGAE